MPKISQEEYRLLKSLDDKWKWITRSWATSLYAHDTEPWKNIMTLQWEGIGNSLRVKGANFHFISWKDDEPYNIAELIREYEHSAEHVSHVVNERLNSIGTAMKKPRDESEEKEVNKQELRKDIKLLARESSQNWPHEEMVELPDVLRIIDQLDEPETLSPEWIEEHSYNIEEYWQVADMMDGAQYAVSVENLQNLLVPKQEEQEPETVASVIADFYKSLERLREVLGTEVEELEE